MHYVSVMKIRKIHELQLTNVRTLLIQVRLGPNIYIYIYIYRYVKVKALPPVLYEK